jgi:hypothetical protein
MKREEGEEEEQSPMIDGVNESVTHRRAHSLHTHSIDSQSSTNPCNKHNETNWDATKPKPKPNPSINHNNKQ